MDARHAQAHLSDLQGTLHWLRSLTPDSPRYKLWLGDMVEFVRAVFGIDSPQMAGVRDVLVGVTVAGLDSAEHSYLARLDRFDALLRGFDEDLTARTAESP